MWAGEEGSDWRGRGFGHRFGEMKAKISIMVAVMTGLAGCGKQESEIPKAVAVPEDEVIVETEPAETTPAEPVAPIEEASSETPPSLEPEPTAPRIVGAGEELEEEKPTAGERLDHAIDSTSRGLKTAGEKTAQGVGVAAEKTGEALQTAGEKTEEGVKKGAAATGRFFKKIGEKLEGAATEDEEE